MPCPSVGNDFLIMRSKSGAMTPRRGDEKPNQLGLRELHLAGRHYLRGGVIRRAVISGSAWSLAPVLPPADCQLLSPCPAEGLK
jgi:hypothetical protein